MRLPPNTVRMVTRPGSPGHDAADDAGSAAERMRPHRSQRIPRLLGRNNGDDLALVGEIERIEPENFAKPPHFLAKGRRGLVDLDRNLRRFGDLVEHGRHAAAGRIADKARARGGG